MVKGTPSRPVLRCQCCDDPLPLGVRSDKKWCSGACQAYANRRSRGVVVENTGRCSSCLMSLAGRQSDATVCTSYKCLAWAARHPGVPHPSTQPRFCKWCGTSIDHKNGKAKFCGKSCAYLDCVSRKRDSINAGRRAAWAKEDSVQKKRQREYRRENADRYRQYARESRVKDPGRYRAYYAAWLADPDNYQLVLLNGHKRRVRVRQNPGSVGVSVRDWLRLVRRYRGCCAYCGVVVDRPIVEHVIPIARGGTHSLGNVVPACGQCNAGKHSSFVMEWRVRQRRAVA